MPAVLQDVEELQPSEPCSTRPERTSRRYFYYSLTLAIVPLVAVLASFLIARSSWYLRHQRNSYLAISDYPFTLKNAGCEVIIYGDSSALTGVSPPVIEATTHLRTCNIAQPNTALAIVGTFAGLLSPEQRTTEIPDFPIHRARFRSSRRKRPPLRRRCPATHQAQAGSRHFHPLRPPSCADPGIFRVHSANCTS